SFPGNSSFADQINAAAHPFAFLSPTALGLTLAYPRKIFICQLRNFKTFPYRQGSILRRLYLVTAERGMRGNFFYYNNLRETKERFAQLKLHLPAVPSPLDF